MIGWSNPREKEKPNKFVVKVFLLMRGVLLKIKVFLSFHITRNRLRLRKTLFYLILYFFFINLGVSR